MKTATDAPEWFLKAIQVAYEERWIEVDDCSIHYQYWGKHGSELPGMDVPGMDVPGILFVHGNGAHSHWWDFIAPSFLSDYRVAAVDLSGMGDSGHRQQYSAQLFADEVMGVAADAGFSGNTILVGHSFGGSVAALAASMHPDQVAALVLVDSAIGFGRRRRSRPESHGSQRVLRQRERTARSYASLQAACKRFRLRPPQPCDNQYILKHIAEHSVRKGSDGWQWKLDQMVFAKMTDSGPAAIRDPVEMIRGLKCPVSIIYGRNSRFFPSAVVANLDSAFAAASIVPIEDAHHHLFLDQPLQFVSSLQETLRNWGL
ncbi:MAG: alpha/beta hydrolase [Pseudomonadales bacterium]|nr:alpha/beta hydrolase [Pseudomonadales bacterium]MDP7595688.1 alpha/beta hydrolase [Pseudomonadales bacterium]HJN51516.1 alpha/beta hydrolase [Pseudomonadales bacterium]